MGTLRSVNVGLPKDVSWHGRTVRTAVWKAPVDGAVMGVNVGLDRLRFPNVVKAGDRIRAHAELVSAEEIKGGVQILVHAIVEIEGEEKPACVADLVTRYFPET